MVINIKNLEVNLRYTIKGLIFFETIKKTHPDGGNIFDAVALLWCFLRAEIDRSDADVNVTLDEFVEWLDDDTARYAECMQWLHHAQAKQEEMLTSEDDGEKKSL